MWSWALLLAAGWLAATVSGAAGFGGAVLLLPVLAYTLGPREAVPVLTLAQLLGNLSRAWFGRDEIRWRPALAFCLGAVPASVVGSRMFIAMPAGSITRVIGVLLLGVVALRHTTLGRRSIPLRLLAPAGMVIGLISGIAGSAGPLGAAVFLGLHLPASSYVATEAVTAASMHATKGLVYGRYAALRGSAIPCGLALGCAMVLGSYTGRLLVKRLPDHWFGAFVECLLILAAVALIFG